MNSEKDELVSHMIDCFCQIDELQRQMHVDFHILMLVKMRMNDIS